MTHGPNGTWIATFTDANSVLWFADRPRRASGTMSAEALAARWKSLFAGSPPYGAMLAPAGPAGHHPTAVQITNPHFSRVGNSFSVTLRPDKGETAADVAWFGKLTRAQATRNGRVVLFVDDADSLNVFTIAAPPGTTFPIAYGTGNCASVGQIYDFQPMPYVVNDPHADSELYIGSFEATTTGSCALESSMAAWNVTFADGTAHSQLQLSTRYFGLYPCLQACTNDGSLVPTAQDGPLSGGSADYLYVDCPGTGCAGDAAPTFLVAAPPGTTFSVADGTGQCGTVQAITATAGNLPSANYDSNLPAYATGDVQYSGWIDATNTGICDNETSWGAWNVTLSDGSAGAQFQVAMEDSGLPLDATGLLRSPIFPYCRMTCALDGSATLVYDP